jgi:hypothetical protein
MPEGFQRYWNAGSVRIVRFGEFEVFKTMREDK